jgi:hypothetical protein
MIIRLSARVGPIDYELGDPSADSQGRVFIPLVNQLTGKGGASITFTADEIAKIAAITQKPGGRRK